MTSKASPRRRGQRDPAVTSRMMAAVRSKDSKAELALRRALHRRGVRYRLHAKDVTGRPDIVIRSRRVAIFVDGDLWHGNEHRRRGLANLADLFPTRTEWWVEKIECNMRRDREVTRELAAAGWTVIRIWESEVLADPEAAASRVIKALEGGRTGSNRWRDAAPSGTAWRPPRGVSKEVRAQEQDRAAGGRENRRMVLPGDRTALASIALRHLPKSRRIYAYLRWSEGGRTRERYVCEVDGPTRAENLAVAWRRALEKGLLTL